MKATAPVWRRHPEAAFEWSLIAIGLAALFALLPHALENDDLSRFSDIEALLHHGHLTDDKYSLVMPLISAPLLLVGEVIKTPMWWAAHFNVVVVAVTVVALAGLLRGRDRRLLRRSVLVLLFASYVVGRLRDYDAEVATAALVTVGVVGLELGRRRVAAWAAIVIGVVNTPAVLLGLVLLAVRDAVRTRRLRNLWPIGAAVALIMLESWVRRGGPFDSGYANDHGYRTLMPYSGKPGFSYPLLFGVLSIVLSFGRGIVFFMPGVVAWFDPRVRQLLGGSRRTVDALLLVTVGMVLVYAKWWAWYGGAALGPRFFTLVVVPASILVAIRLERAAASIWWDVATIALLTLSTWVAIVGAAASLHSLDVCASNNYSYEPFCWYSPEFSPLGNPLVSFPPVSAGVAAIIALCLLTFVYLASEPASRLVRSALDRQPRGLLREWRF